MNPTPERRRSSHFRTLACALAAMLALTATTQAGTLVSYEFGTTNKLKPTTTAEGLEAGSISITAYTDATSTGYYGLASNSANLFTRLANRAQADSDPEIPFAAGSTLENAINNGGYYSLTIDAGEGTLLDLTSFTVQLGTERLNSASGFTACAWLCDENNNPLGSTTKDATAAGATSLSWKNLDVDLSALAPAASFTFRIYVAGVPTDAAEYNQVIRLRNITFTGSVTAIPEPGAWALITGAVLLSFALRRVRSSRDSR
ncbi:MAG: cell wall anchor protein [Opitutaceae bacterium]|jgi:hypothetical protein|nr:cell wall anchor protein [Opitutaceae bacterium]